ncbi:MAG: heme oxygenase (biliverdin-producing) [Halothece sp.]
MNNCLATRLREGTKHSHTLAENTTFMKCFLKGVMEASVIRKLFGNLYLVYRALEGELQRHQDHPVVGKIYFPSLNRQVNLGKDLAFYYGENWTEKLETLPATKTYVARLHSLSQTHPELLVAHSYTRYLGDLSGGQGLKRIVRSAIALPEGQGTAFYEFDQLEDIREFKQQYREALNSLPVDEKTIEAIVAEANHAFALNRDVMHELEGDLIRVLSSEKLAEILQEHHLGSTEAVSA